MSGMSKAARARGGWAERMPVGWGNAMGVLCIPAAGLALAAVMAFVGYAFNGQFDSPSFVAFCLTAPVAYFLAQPWLVERR